MRNAKNEFGIVLPEDDLTREVIEKEADQWWQSLDLTEKIQCRLAIEEKIKIKPIEYSSNKIGPVEIIQSSDKTTNPTYNLHCDFVDDCEWHRYKIDNWEVARLAAQWHFEFHNKFGPKSNEWKDLK